jgi:hypothetical protein
MSGKGGVAVRRRTIASVVISCLFAVGCQGGASPSVPGTTSAPTSAASPPSGASPGASPSPAASDGAGPGGSPGAAGELEIAASEYAFETAASVPAGPVSIRLTNEGEEEHQAQIARVAEGRTFEDVVGALSNPDPSGAFEILTFVGGPTGVMPGEEQVVASVLEPGLHVLVCFVAAPDGVPHLAKGMIAQLDVTEPAQTGSLPAGDAELTLQDFAFVGLDSLPTGEQVVTVTNNGPQPHEATVVRLTEGVSVDDIRGMLTASPPPSGPPPWTPAGGIAAIAPESEATMTLDLEAGDYALVCFVPDPASGKAHLELGMIGGLTVQ